LVASLVGDGFRSHHMESPPKGAATGAIHLLFALLASGPFLLAMSGSLLQLGTLLPPLKVLPVDFPSPPWPVGVMTLKNRTRSPVTGLFIECVREVVKPLLARHPSVGRARTVPARNSRTAISSRSPFSHVADSRRTSPQVVSEADVRYLQQV